MQIFNYIKITIQIFVVILLFGAFIGCGKADKSYQEKTTIKGKVDTNLFSSNGHKFDTAENNHLNSTNNEVVLDNGVRLAFNEFVLLIDSFLVWDENGILNKKHQDTVRVYLELGETVEGRKIGIRKQKNIKLNIFQRFENSITIMNEGPHCDLTEWKHYNSVWKKINILNDEFVTESYTEKDRIRFIEVEMTDLRNAVRKECGERWEQLIKDVQSPLEYPCGVGMSRVFLKFECINILDGTIKERIVSFEIPMGC